MFQNVAYVDNSEQRVNSSVRVLYRLKNIFKYQNVIIYVLTFLLSMLSIKDSIMPFGLAMIAACVGSEIPVVGVYVCALLGTGIGNGLPSVGNFIIVSLLYFLFVLIFRSKIAVEERNEGLKTGGKLFAACFIVQLVSSFIGVFLWYDVFMGIISSSIIYVFYKIFVNGLASIKNFKIKKAFTIEELIATVLMIGLAASVFNNINIFSVNLTNIIIILMIMVLGWKNGMLLGAVSGLALGIGIGFVEGINFIQILMFAVSGMLSGILNKFGKIGVIAGFLLGNAILTYWLRESSTMIIYFREIFIASLGLLLVPNRFKLDIEEIYGKEKYLTDSGDRRLEGHNEDVSKKLKTISELFESLTTEISKEEIEERENFIQDFLDNLEEIKNNIFYEEISNEENGIARDICTVLGKNEVVTDIDLIEILKVHNNYVIMQDHNIKNDLQEVVKIANRTLKIFQINRAKELERRKTVNAINENLKEVSKVLDKCADQAEEERESTFANKEKEVLILLKSKNFLVYECKIKQLKNKKYIVELKCDIKDYRIKEKEIITSISDVITKSLGTKIVFQRDRINEENNDYTQIYSSEDKFVLQVGSAKITKDNSSVSGDCSLQIKLADGKYLLAIADGMGSGEKAREWSKLSLRLIKQMLCAGFDSEDSLKLINSRLNFDGASKRYSTLDISVLDLYVGQAEFLKNAACTTYIKNKKNVNKVKIDNLPVGMIENIELKTKVQELSDGDIIVMCSDGIIESKSEDDNWICDFLKNITTNNVQKMADLILAESLDNSYGVAQDDMTVIVCKIVKRK